MITIMMTDKTLAESPRPIHLKDYRPPDFLVEDVDLRIELGEERTHVRARLRMRRSPSGAARPLELNGQDIELRSLALDGRALAPGEYSTGAESLCIFSVPERFVLEVENELRPQDNTSLEGLYRSSGNFCTQCEAEGFRKITYYLDRPDVLAVFTVTLVAAEQRYPVLLCNGNLVDSGALEDGRHWAKWHDPFPKPCYLFALVAGDLACVGDEFVTRSRRRVELFVYTEHHNADKCAHALASLKKAMKWDEDAYGREYDLDRYMIVAVDDFNMGAMENKGLNIFNSKYVLAKPQTATDRDFQNIESVIGHEYFHNWSGNRVTCRDWFQLSLKEGFTIFRDQEFSADMNSRAVKRIEDVDLLRTYQYREDAGPMAHAVRPQSYVEINNFYTLTVYNKGAEVIRMLHLLAGPEGFRRGCDLYFERYDGQAVTTDDFVKAMEDANGLDLEQFRLWYDQAGTPRLTVTRQHDPDSCTYRLTIEQSCRASPGERHKRPFHIPLRVALLDAAGERIALRLAGGASPAQADLDRGILHLREERQSFVFENVPTAPVPSLLRDFSAPVILGCDLGDDELRFLTLHDDDPFNRWDAGQVLARKHLLELIDRARRGVELELHPALVDAFRAGLDCVGSHDEAFVALSLELPSETLLGEALEVVDPDAVHRARRFARRRLAEQSTDDLEALHERLSAQAAYANDPASIGRRSLRNLCLSYLMELENEDVWSRCVRQFDDADNMTDSMAALTALVDSSCPQRERALKGFYERWRDDPLVIDKWFVVQARSPHPLTPSVVRSLTRHEAFNIRNPNRVRALIGAFGSGNPLHFHALDGSGYRLLGEYVRRLDAINPQVAARLATPFTQWRRYDERRQALMQAELERTAEIKGLSKDVLEIVSKTLA